MMTDQEYERLQDLCEDLNDLIEEGENSDLSQPLEFLSRQKLLDVAQMALVCVRDARFTESSIIRKFWLRVPHNMGISEMAPFDRALDAALLEAATSVDNLIGMVQFLEDPEEMSEESDDAIDVVKEVVNGLTEDEAVSALVGVSLEASQSNREDRLLGAWQVYLENAGDSAHSQLKVMAIFDRAIKDMAEILAA